MERELRSLVLDSVILGTMFSFMSVALFRGQFMLVGLVALMCWNQVSVVRRHLRRLEKSSVS